MKFHFEAGAEIDVVSSAELTEFGNVLRKDVRTPKPLHHRVAGNEVGAGAPLTIATTAAPPTGSVWAITSIATWGDDAFTVVSGVTAAMFFGNPSNPGLSQLMFPGISFPMFADMSSALWVPPGQQVFLVTSGNVTSGQQLGYSLAIEEYLIRDIARISARNA